MFQPEDVPYNEAHPTQSLEDCLALWCRADAAFQDPSSPPAQSPRSAEEATENPEVFAQNLSTRLARYALSADSGDSPPRASLQTVLESASSPGEEEQQKHQGESTTATTAPSASTQGTTSPVPSAAPSSAQDKTSRVRFAPLPVPDRGLVPATTRTRAEGRIRASATDMAALTEGIRTGKVKVSVGQLAEATGLAEPQEGEVYQLRIAPADRRGILRNGTRRRE
ncbi:hypothetical protein ACHAQA_006303 [Verticillium albo-atrum]